MNHIKLLAKKLNVPLLDLSGEWKEKLDISVQAQKRTANHKKAVFVFPELVFKGPYQEDDVQLQNNLIYNFAIQQLETLLELEEKYKSFLPWKYLGYFEKKYYLISKNVGIWDKAVVENVSSKIETNVNVIQRETMVYRVSELEKKETLNDHIKIACLQHLYLRFILNIGDSGTYNILKREDYSENSQLIIGIDMEERRKFVEKDIFLEALLKKCSKLQEKLYTPFLKYIKMLSVEDIPLTIYQEFESIGIDIENVKKHITIAKTLYDKN